MNIFARRPHVDAFLIGIIAQGVVGLAISISTLVILWRAWP